LLQGHAKGGPKRGRPIVVEAHQEDPAALRYEAQEVLGVARPELFRQRHQRRAIVDGGDRPSERGAELEKITGQGQDGAVLKGYKTSALSGVVGDVLLLEEISQRLLYKLGAHHLAAEGREVGHIAGLAAERDEH